MKQNLKKEVQAIMWEHCGIVRSMNGLKAGLEKLRKLEKHSREDFEFRNFLDSAKLVIESALKRKESRGLQCLTDYPEKNSKYLKHYTIKKN